MDFVNMFEMLGDNNPSEDLNNTTYPANEPMYVDTCSDNWNNEFTGFKASPSLYNMNGYISPYASNNWGASSECLKSILDDGSRLPALTETKVDPNKIFNSDIASLKALAADQQRMTKMFEKKLIEGLTEKGKVGLTEVDIEAMQALTSARSSITSINKEQINIKKNIADLRIKQNQQIKQQNAQSTGGAPTSSKGVVSSYDVGRSILDTLFDQPISEPTQNVDSNTYSTVSYDEANTVIDNIISNTNGIDTYTKYESLSPTTYVVMPRGGNENDCEFETYTESGELIEDYPKPNSKITTLDKENNVCTDSFLVQYPIKFID